jgi:putative nucleotidyltransferase with HDIG domain
MDMTRSALREVDFERHGRRFQVAAAAGFALGVCDARGAPVWVAEDRAPEFAQALAEAGADGIAGDVPLAGCRHRMLQDGRTILSAAIALPSAAPIGYVVAVGDLMWLESAATAAVTQALEDIAAAIRDEQRLRYELDCLSAELAERYEELHLVYGIDALIREFEGGWEVLRKLLELCAGHMNVDLAAFVYPRLDLTLSATQLSKPMFNLDLVLCELRGDLYRFVQAGRESVAINEAQDPRRGYIFTDMPYKLLASPLYLGGEVAAMLALINHDDKPDFTASDRKLMEVMANQFSNLLHMCRLLDEQRTFNRQVVSALIEAVEAKDPYTRGHSDRVRAISVDIGRELDLPAADLDNLAWAAVLHDVGKIGVPDAVLCKPGPLTRDEYTFIKVHSERGCEILRHIDRLQQCVPIVRHHHERFTGGGYPQGISGRAIPLGARIIAVADTYDAMTSSRAYRAGRSHGEAVAEIRRVSGTQLDPQVVDAFLRVCERTPSWLGTIAAGAATAHG